AEVHGGDCLGWSCRHSVGTVPCPPREGVRSTPPLLIRQDPGRDGVNPLRVDHIVREVQVRILVVEAAHMTDVFGAWPGGRSTWRSIRRVLSRAGLRQGIRLR